MTFKTELASASLVLVLIWALFYFQMRWLKRRPEFFDQAAVMLDQRINLAITDAFMAHLRRQPKDAELVAIANEIKPKLKGMPLGKNDLTKLALGIIKDRKITA